MKALIKLVLLKESTVYIVLIFYILALVSCDYILAGTFIRNF